MSIEQIPLIPMVKILQIKDGYLQDKMINYHEEGLDERLISALKKLPCKADGIPIEFHISEKSGEDYEIWIKEDCIHIKAGGNEGAFYAIQTLRQLFVQDRVPCLYIKDKPDFVYRGFYHDVTRGKVPTVDSIKSLIDDMAYYKLNSL